MGCWPWQEKRTEATGVLGSLMLTGRLSAFGTIAASASIEVGSADFEYADAPYWRNIWAPKSWSRLPGCMGLPMQIAGHGVQ